MSNSFDQVTAQELYRWQQSKATQALKRKLKELWKEKLIQAAQKGLSSENRHYISGEANQVAEILDDYFKEVEE